MFVQIRNNYPRTCLIVYLLAATLIIDGGMAKVFWQRLATHKNYFTVGVRSKNLYFHHSYEKNVTARARWGNTIYPLATNSLGFLDSQNRSIKLQPEGKRVIFLGDSFTEGLGLPFDKTFVGIISAQSGKKYIEVLNAAVASYSPKLYYLKMRYLLETLGLTCDEIVVFLDMSDVQDEIVYKKYVPENRELDRSLADSVRMYAIRHSVIGNLTDRFVMYLENRLGEQLDIVDEEMQKIRSNYVNYEDSLYERSGWYSEGNYPLWGREGSALATHYMTELVKLCRSHNVKVTLVVYPWPRQVVENVADNFHVLYWRQFSQEQNIQFINYYPLFMPTDPGNLLDRYFLPSDIHFNEAGHALIAEEFLKWRATQGE